MMVQPQSIYEEKYDASPEAFASWGKTKEQACRNCRAYDQWLSCGFKGEPEFDSFGWLKNGMHIKADETILLWTNGTADNTVECAQLPNGKWISGIHYMLSLTGQVNGLSIWNHQYNSRVEALSTPMRSLIESIKKNGLERDKAHIAEIVKALDDVRQLSLF